MVRQGWAETIRTGRPARRSRARHGWLLAWKSLFCPDGGLLSIYITALPLHYNEFGITERKQERVII
jgi:hypothetical protein